MYGIVKTGLDCLPNISLNGSSIIVHPSVAKAGDNFTVCVMLQDNDCIAAVLLTNVTGKDLHFNLG